MFIIIIIIFTEEGFSAQWDCAERCMETTKLINDDIFIFRTLLKISLAADNLTGLRGVPYLSHFFAGVILVFSLAANEMWGNYRMIHLTTGGIWLSHRAAVHKLAYSHPVCRIAAPASHSEQLRHNLVVAV